MTRKRDRRWLREHRGDTYVRGARASGYRARAVYKLREIDERDRLLRPGMTVLDLGAAPGSWSQYAARRVSPGGRVVAVDVVEVVDLGAPEAVRFVRGDPGDPEVMARIRVALAGPAQLVLSDMAPNISGVRSADQARAMRLAELALDTARAVLAPGGALLLKVFQGEGVDGFRRELRSCFRRVAVRKPAASRDRSRELYLLARGFEAPG